MSERILHHPLWGIVFVVGLLLGCGVVAAANTSPASSDDNLKKRASFDLSCPESALVVSDLSSNNTVKGVSGCDRRATYVWNNRAWVMNNDSQPK